MEQICDVSVSDVVNKYSMGSVAFESFSSWFGSCCQHRCPPWTAPKRTVSSYAVADEIVPSILQNSLLYRSYEVKVSIE